ncbi:hypothetical protein HNY73_003872 [Argiope bruennichi]|uniref:Uncharacterized protein n=1 Tax=Argiope bruennichi TaxID=94029 RepID=A0A8T0FNW3_ARGBR|nr:hypothetical protein HNY73_003872 [Argiope bruennichi]
MSSCTRRTSANPATSILSQYYRLDLCANGLLVRCRLFTGPRGCVPLFDVAFPPSTPPPESSTPPCRAPERGTLQAIGSHGAIP